MIDTIHFSIPITAEDAERIPELLTAGHDSIDRETGEISFTGTIRNLRVSGNECWLNVDGSITKFFYGNNWQNMNLVDLRQAIAELESILGISLLKAKVSRLDVAFVFSMEHHVGAYLPLLRHYPRATPNRFNDGINGMHFRNDSMSYSFYDKRKERKDKGVIIPAEFGKYLLRVEWSQKQRVERLLGRSLYIADLLTDSVWKVLLQKYKERYFKIGRDCGSEEIMELDSKIRGVSYE